MWIVAARLVLGDLTSRSGYWFEVSLCLITVASLLEGGIIDRESEGDGTKERVRKRERGGKRWEKGGGGGGGGRIKRETE